MTQVFKAPEPFPFYNRQTRIFLGGSIDQGKAVDWQQEVTDRLSRYSDDLVILNPRREAWDATLKQDISNPVFAEQVNWELSALEKSDIRIFYFDPNGLAPITLMELGRFHEDALVCCPPGYWRRGNVQVFCDRYNVPLFKNIDDLIYNIELKLSRVL